MILITSLFETFDPLISPLSLNISILGLILSSPLIYLFFMKKNRQNQTFSALQNYLFSELSAAITSKNRQTPVIILFSVFIFILLINLTGLIPYVYTLTSQIMITLSLALPLWGAIIIFNIFVNTSHFLSHLVPLSTPLILSQFITIIESISQIIRPITLSVRLCANMTAGHILIALTSNTILIFRTSSIPLIILIRLELAVAFIQRYVFTILLSIYLTETE